MRMNTIKFMEIITLTLMFSLFMPLMVFATPAATITGNFTVTIENVSQPIETNETTRGLLIISQCPDSAEITQGTSKTISITIKNNESGSITDISLGATGITTTWVSFGAISSLETGETKDVNVTFNIPKTATVELKTVTISVAGKSGTVEVKDEKKLSLKVLPDEDTKATIQEMYDNYMSQAIDMNKTISKLTKQGKDTTVAQSIFDDIWSKLSAAKAGIDKGDYFSAFTNLKDLGTKIDLANKEIEKISKGFPFWIYILIAVVIIIVAVLAYMFFPSKGEETEEYEEEYEEGPEE